jgi:hypothetical protein
MDEQLGYRKRIIAFSPAAGAAALRNWADLTPIILPDGAG